MKLLNRFYHVSANTLTHSFDASAYLLDTDRGLYLIDCGTPEGYEKLLKNIRELGFDPGNIAGILGTHGHYDHLGAASLFKKEFSIPLYLHEEDREQVETGDPVRTTASILYGTEFPPCTVDTLLTHQQKFDLRNAKLEILHTPGHTPGSISIVLETAELTTLIAADTLFGGFSDRIGSDEKRWKKSLELLSSRSFDLLCFGHSSPVLLSDANARIASAKKSFANYYNPWFKDFFNTYTY